MLIVILKSSTDYLSGPFFFPACYQSDLSLVNSVGQKFSSRAENHLCQKSMWIILLKESKAAEPTLQTLQKLMRTEIQAHKIWDRAR